MTATTITIADPATVPDGQLAAFNPAELDMSANSRTDAAVRTACFGPTMTA